MNNFKKLHAHIVHFGRVGFREKESRGQEKSQTILENNNKENVI